MGGHAKDPQLELSILMPTRRRESALENSLSGLLQQKASSGTFEVLVIDNDPGGSAKDICYELSADLRLRHIWCPDLIDDYPLASMRNRGLAAADAPLIVCLDADCIPNNSYVSAVHNALISNSEQNSIIAGERRFIDATGIQADQIASGTLKLDNLPPTASASNAGLVYDKRFPELRTIQNSLHPWDYLHGGNIAFRKLSAIKVGGFDPTYDGRHGYEDIDFAYRLITIAGAQPRYVADMHVYHQEPTPADTCTVKGRTNNPNFERVCEVIPGYFEYKTRAR